jgi:IclR family acetate operon transcriptional repressor
MTPDKRQSAGVHARRAAATPRDRRGAKPRAVKRPAKRASGKPEARNARRARDIVSRVLSALEYVALAKQPVTAADLSADLGIPRASAYRIFARLEQEQVLIPEPAGRGFTEGRRLCDFAVTVLTNSARHGARHRVLQRLVDQLGETCNLTMLCEGEVVYVDRVETDWPLRMHLSPGSRVPIHCTATGKLLLSLLPERQMSELVRAASLRRYTERTITDPAQLIAALARIREERIGIDDEEFAAGMVAVAVPVLDARGRACAALAVHAPAVRLSLEAARQHVPTLREAAASLAKLLR